MNHADGADAGLSPFERDIADQADALRGYAHSVLPPEVSTLARGQYDRVILTGMGSSHFAALPAWRKLVAAGCPAWWADSSQLLDAPRLITPDSLLVASSQSGASGEVVALLERLGGARRPAAIIGITNDPASPLAEHADTFIPLLSGNEATVSTKSYLNTLAALDRLTALLTGAPAEDAWDTVKTVEAFSGSAALAGLAAAVTAAPDARLAFVGFAEHAATALYAGLITKEAAKIPAEGFIGGQFRHGPLELAGPGLTAVLFAGDSSDARSPRQLGTDLVTTGSTVLTVGELGIAGAVEVPGPSGGASAQLAHGAITAQYLTVALAKARGITPGAFSYGNKITTAL